MSTDPVPSVVRAVAHRSACISDALSGLSKDALLHPSLLPDWSRLTVACHLRFGAEALLRMTDAGISGERVAFYPGGRARQRPETLEPGPGEGPQDVVASLCRLSAELDDLWSALDAGTWDREVAEPDDNPDLGTSPLSYLPLLRLTEVEVHGSDLGLALDEWSDVFVRTALPARLRMLSSRRTNHRAFDRSVQGTWLLVARDGPTFSVTVRGDEVRSRRADPESAARATIETTSRDLLALLLGRPLHEAPRILGDVRFGRAFQAAFPGP